MRSGACHTISSREVHAWALNWLQEVKLLADHGWLCTAAVVWSIVLRAAARRISVHAACNDLARAPSGQAVMTALTDGLPQTLKVLERRLNEVLTIRLSRGMRRRRWEVAIDWHLVPYYGDPKNSPNELCSGQPRDGTTTFHAYATACIVCYGRRYTLALCWVRRHESKVAILARLMARIREIGLKIRYVLLDRDFFSVPVMAFLQQENLPFLMPVKFRGPKPKSGRLTGLRAFKRRRAGWYTHTMKSGKGQVSFRICVAYRTYRHRKRGTRANQKLLYAAWRMADAPTEIRDRYRTRFGIETSFRQLRQARIYTCTQDPHLRLVFIAIALLLRNLWVWIHETILAEGRGLTMTLNLHRLRFKRLLDWIATTTVSQLHDGTTPYVETG
jgi:hypothetical protein